MCLRVIFNIVWVCLVLSMSCYADENIAAGNQAASDIGFQAVNKWGTPSGIMTNLTDPILNGSMMQPLGGAQSMYECPSTRKSFKTLAACNAVCPKNCVEGFSISGIFEAKGTAFLEITITPSAGGEIYPLFIRIDSDFNGSYDTNTQFGTNISGVCSDGFISCSSGTWKNCKYYSWTANSNLKVSATEVPSTSVGGCYCINNSCGTMLVWNNIDSILKTIGDGIALAIQKADPHCIIKRANTDSANMRITYYGIRTDDMDINDNVDTSKLSYDLRAGIDDPEKYYSSPHLLSTVGVNELEGQLGDSNSLWALTQQADTGGEQKTCIISHDVDYSTTWSCLITCYISNAGRTFIDNEITRSTNVPGICAMAYDRCSSGLYGEYYGDAPYDFGGGYMPCTPNGATKTHCESGGNTWSLAGTYGYPMPGGVCYARDSYGTRTGSQCPENIIPSGTEVVGVDQYPYVHMIGKHTAGLYCIRKTFYQGYVDNYYCNLAHEGAEQIGTDHSHVSTVNTCNSIDKNKCKLTYEEKCDAQGSCVQTMINGNYTGLKTLETCKTVSSEKTTYKVCWNESGKIISTNQQTGEKETLVNNAEGWTVKRTYFCGNEMNFDYSGILSRGAMIQDTFSASGNMASATFRDSVLGNTTINTILGNSYGDCEYQCRVQAVTLKTHTNAVTGQGEYLSDTSSPSEYSKPCRLLQNGSYSCPLEEGESLVSGCICTTNFAEAMIGLSVVKEASKDMICTSD